jgi:hypothetical protein
MAISYASLGGSSKTMYRTTLLSGTSYTVPAGVTYLNVTLTGGGGGSGGTGAGGTNGSSGGTTTFTGANSAVGGRGGAASSNGDSVQGAAGTSNTGEGGGPTTGVYSTSGVHQSPKGLTGAVISSTLSCTPGASITYAIGAGGGGGSSNYGPAVGAAGGSGKIDVEYWA